MSETLSSLQRPLDSASLARVHAEPPSTPPNKFRTAAKLEESDADTIDESIIIHNGTAYTHGYTSSALGLSITPRIQSTVTPTDSHKTAFLPSERLEQASSSCEVYTATLFPLKYGYPLWLPEPDLNLPVEYRRTGVSAGDLGIVTPDGGFDFIFNIGRSVLDPINPDDLPEDFVPLPLPKSGISFQTIFNAGTHVSNMEITSDEDPLTKCTRNTTPDVSILTLRFRSTSYNCKVSGKGALLSLPLGACQENAKNIQRIKDYISANALRWYNYAIDIGRDLDRHSLYLVTGSVKSPAWGIATFDKNTVERDSVFVIGEPEAGFASNRPPYVWKKSGGASSFRTGPTPDRLPSDLVNQCLFIRGLKISLSESTWDSILKSKSIVTTNENRKRPFFSDDSDEERASKKSRNDEDESRDRGKNSNNPNIGNTISITSFPSTSRVFHPLSTINDLLFSQVPEARVAITHDDIWLGSNIEKFNLSSVNHFVGTIKGDYIVGFCEDTKTCTLEPRFDILKSLWDRNLHTAYPISPRAEGAASMLYDPEGTPESPDVSTNSLTIPELFNAASTLLTPNSSKTQLTAIINMLPTLLWGPVPSDEQTEYQE